MKFTKGMWMMRDGVMANNCEQIREVTLSKDKTSLYIYAVPYKADVRALGGPMLEIYVSSPKKDIIRFKTVHFRGDLAKYPEFELEDDKLPLKVTESKDGKITVVSGDTSLIIGKNPCSFDFFYKEKPLTNIGQRYGTPLLSHMETPEGPHMRVQLDTRIGEKVYGFGERFTPFVKNGQVVETWNEDGGTATEIAYKSIPFYVTNNGYGIFVNDSGPVSYEVCTENVMSVQLSVPGEKLDFMVVGGGDIKTVIQNYTALTGRPALPPAWSYGLWLTTSFTTSYDEKTVTSFVDGMSERDIPLSVFHIDCYWMKESQWCDFEWDKEAFPDVKSYLKRLHEKGLKVCVWINPYIGQKSEVFDECKSNGYFLKNLDGNIWQWDLWQPGLAILDFTNPEAVEWYKNKLRRLLDEGVDSFKTDFGERIPVDVTYHNGSDPLRMHNYYVHIYNKIVFEVLEERRGKGETCLFARSATAGGQKFPVHWGGDCNSTLPSMYESLRGGLSLCMSGFGFWSHDIGGFEGNAPAEVYKRWLAFGLLSTHSRLHGSTSYRVPWLFGEESVKVCRKFAKLKNQLMPYIFGISNEAHKTGVPAMRSMVMEFEGDLGAEDCDRQYMLGDSLLVAPVFSEDGTVDVYLPKGEWTDFWTGKKVKGNGWRREKHNFFSLPLYIRENSILPIGKNEDRPEYDYASDLTLRVCSLMGTPTVREIYDTKGKKVFTISAVKKANEASINFVGNYKNITIDIDGKKITADKKEMKIKL
ncbi:MAG: alpha-xylosidase [Firmicutes bacterium]|nr:alpha-xylosidase [Bacillota bacterium]